MNIQDSNKQDTNSPLSTDIDSPAADDKLNTPVLTKPRHWIIESMLIFSTFGLGACLWIFFRVRDLNKLEKGNFIPWLWLFVPFIFLAQLVALPKFTKAVEKLGRKNGANPQPDMGVLWIIVIAGTTLFFNLSDKFEMPYITILAALFIASLAYGLYHRHATKVILSTQNVTFKTRNKFLTSIDLLIISILFPFIIWTTYELSIKPLLAGSLREFRNGEVFTDKDLGFQLRFHQEGWKRVPIGLYSDGSALYEFGGPYEEVHIIIFDHSPNTDLDDVSYWRIADFRDSLTSEKCEHEKYFESGVSDIVSFAYCDGTDMLFRGLHVTKTIKVENHTLELLGYFSAAEETYKDQKDNFIRTVKEFRKAQ